VSKVEVRLDPTLAFQLKDGMVWVGARVKGHEVNGILDSDSDQTFVDTETAERLGLRNRKTQSAPVSDVVSFDLGPSSLIAPKPTILPIRNQILGMDFILGFDALGKTPFTVDYSKSVILLGTLPQGRKVPFLSGKDVPSTRVSFSNLGLNAVVDTGAPAGLDIPFPWVKSSLPSVQFEKPVGRKDLGPRYEALPFTISEALIGGTKLSNVKASAIRRKDNPLENQGGNWATIGNHVLSRFTQIGIDGLNRNCVFVT
jgi:hypothetical protein